MNAKPKKPASKRGRKTGKRPAYKFDAKRKEAYTALLREGGRRHVSARAVGISPQTVALHMRDDEAFRSAVMYAEMEADDEVEDALRMAAISGNVTAALAWLYSRRPERWSDTRKLKVDLSAELIKLMRKHGLTLSDLQEDPLLAAFYEASGVKIAELTDPTGEGK